MRWAALAVALIAVAGVVWGAGELHYRSCVTAAEARTPMTVSRGRPYSAAPVENVTHGSAARKRAVDGCSRIP
jgi:hypothetical protein